MKRSESFGATSIKQSTNGGEMEDRILIVDDDPSIGEVLQLFLSGEGFDTRVATSGTEALTVFSEYQPGMVLLDLNLPGLDGIAVCKAIREESATPIIMLTARADNNDVITGLEVGADDYVTKPFEPQVLLARIRASLRRPTSQNLNTISVGDVVIDLKAHEVTRAGELIPLTPLEFEILHTLAAAPEQVFTREKLLEAVWGYHYKSDTRLVNVHVQRLRSKVELNPDDPKVVVTVRGIGYRAGETFSS